MRIWYQSYVDDENGKTYWDRLRRHLENKCVDLVNSEAAFGNIPLFM